MENAKKATVPIVSIDAIAIGAEVTVDINEHGANKDFLYLTMKCGSGLRNWWRLRWIDKMAIDCE